MKPPKARINFAMLHQFLIKRLCFPMDDSLINTIQTYAESRMSSEMQAEITSSITLCDAFEYTILYETMPDVLFDTSVDDINDTQAKFLMVIHGAMDDLLKVHSITVQLETDLHVKNQILSALYRIQHLEDPVPMLRILETDLSNEEKLAKIIEALSTLDETVVLTSIEHFQDELLTALSQFLSDQETREAAQEQADIETNTELLNNLKDFFTHHGSDNLANQMLQNNIEAGYPIAMYLPYLQEQLVVPDDLQTTKNLLSFFFMASDTYRDPLSAYRQYSEELIHDHERVMRIETLLCQLTNDLRHYQEATHVAKRLSSV